jgi:bacterioferritin (cytochrome b1)
MCVSAPIFSGRRHTLGPCIEHIGKPDFNPDALVQRSHAEYDAADGVKAMIKANLIAARVAIEVCRQMKERIGDSDPTARMMLVGIMAKEEKHATTCATCWLDCRACLEDRALARR